MGRLGFVVMLDVWCFGTSIDHYGVLMPKLAGGALCIRRLKGLVPVGTEQSLKV